MTWNLISFIKKRRSHAVTAAAPEASVKADADTLAPLDLAFIGDTVFDLMVREDLLARGSAPVNTLHRQAVSRVRCEAQALGAELIMPVLTEKELDVYRRGRNAKVSGIPKNATAAQYHSATGLEALFGWLYLKDCGERIEELFSTISKGETEFENK